MTTASVTVTSSDIDNAARSLTAAGYKRVAGAITAKAIRQSVNLIRKNVRAELKPHNKSGKMRDRIRVRFTGSQMTFVGGMKSTGVGSNLVVGGASAHAIQPGKVMPMWQGRGAWKGGRGAGVTGFAARVEHPGFRGDPFVARGIDRSMPDIDAILQSSADNMVRELARRMQTGRP